MKTDPLTAQIDFIVEVDKLKQVLRQTLLISDRRQEPDAEHSWHLALMACLLAGHAPEEIDLLRAVRMLLFHDVVEIDAGDTFAYDTRGNEDRIERERAAAARLFGMLPPAQAEEYRSLWEEFEERKTPEAKFACLSTPQELQEGGEKQRIGNFVLGPRRTWAGITAIQSVWLSFPSTRAAVQEFRAAKTSVNDGQPSRE